MVMGKVELLLACMLVEVVAPLVDVLVLPGRLATVKAGLRVS